jgi:hypothetical protein
MTTQSASATTGIGRALLGGLAAGVVAAAVNAALFATGLIDQSVVVPTGDPVSLGAVISLSLVPNIIGGLVLWGVLRAGRGVRLFQIIVAVVTVLSFVTPFSLPGAPLSMILILELMHVVAGAAAAFVTPRVAGEA